MTDRGFLRRMGAKCVVLAVLGIVAPASARTALGAALPGRLPAVASFAAAASALPDGTHTAFVTKATTTTISFDKVDFLTGKEAIDAARQEGALDADGSLPDDYFIRNKNPLVRTLRIAARARLRVLAQPGDPGSAHVMTPAAFAAYARTYPRFLATLAVKGGKIVGVEPIFVP